MAGTTLDTIEDIMNRKLVLLPEKLRPVFEELATRSSRGTMVVGPRGTGKTTYLLSRVRGKNLLYFSADSPLMAAKSLWDIGVAAFKEGYDGIAVDEVHFAKEWSLSLKALFDSYPNKVFFASDSSSIILRTGLADLSRRFIQVNVPLLSFREFIFFKTEMLFPKIALPDFDRKIVQNIFRSLNINKLFKEYLKEGSRPIFFEGNYQDRILNIIEKTIFSDIPFFVPSIVDNNFRLLNAVMDFLAHSKIPQLAIRSLCTEWGIGALKLYKLLFVMEHVGLIRIIRRQKDFKANSSGEKVFLYDPTMYSALHGDIGNIREAFVAGAFVDAGFRVFAPKNESECDFILESPMGNSSLAGKDWKIEVGGKNKSHKQVDVVVRDDIDLPGKDIIPMWLLGFGS
ncbi:MAG: AAA family ATPase [Candidatus Ozemobacteraceae bacterium]